MLNIVATTYALTSLQSVAYALPAIVNHLERSHGGADPDNIPPICMTAIPKSMNCRPWRERYAGLKLRCWSESVLASFHKLQQKPST